MTQSSYSFTKSADRDLEGIIGYTLDKHGNTQARNYSKQLAKCLDKLSHEKGQTRLMLNLHPALRYIRCEHHYIFGKQRNENSMLIIAILHERMDLISRVVHRLQ